MLFELGSRARRVIGAVGMLAVVGGAVAGCEPPPPVVVENPGVYTGTNGPGSYYEYLDADGTPMERSFFDAGNPACANGIDDDADGLVDAGADPDCNSPDDANERLDDVQEYGGSSLTVTIEDDGRFVVDPSELRVEPMEKCLISSGELWCLEIQPRGTGPIRYGSASPDLIVLPIPMVIDFDLISGYPGFDERCQVGYTENLYWSDDYDEATGVMRLQTIPDNLVPAIENCGQWTDLLNSVLGLPGTGHSELVVTLANDEGESPRFAR